MKGLKAGVTVFLSSLLFNACSGQDTAKGSSEGSSIVVEEPAIKDTLIQPMGNTIYSRFSPPKGFERIEVSSNSFAGYLRNLPLKPHGTLVQYYDGRVKPDQGIYLGVVDMDIGKRDLQQCADAIIRLRAEYLFKQKRYDDIQFNFTNGFPADYYSWQKGKRIKVDGNKVYWYEAKSPDSSYSTFRSYLNMVFAYAGTRSLEKEMEIIPLEELQIGDVLIQGGSPGHAVIVVDMAFQPESGAIVFLLAQSYMPAQETQVLINPLNPHMSPWFELIPDKQLVTPEWRFDPKDLKRF